MPRLSRFMACFAKCLPALLVWPLLCWAAESDVVMVANQDVPLQALPALHAKAIFSMRVQQWPDHRQVKVFVLPDRHPLHEFFCKSELKVFPHQMRTAWDRQVFSGTGQAPTEVHSEEDMLARVASTPGAVGYISREKADDPRIKKILIKGNHNG